jgi:serine/threonine protein kinase
MKGKLTSRPAQHSGTLTADHGLVSPAQALLQELLGSSIALAEDWEALSPDERETLLQCAGEEALLRGLVENKLLTEYQAARVEAGKTFGLILGNYRVLDRIGAGGVGVVFKAENLDIRRVVAVKVQLLHHDQDPQVLRRFVIEMRAVSRL